MDLPCHKNRFCFKHIKLQHQKISLYGQIVCTFSIVSIPTWAMREQINEDMPDIVKITYPSPVTCDL